MFTCLVAMIAALSLYPLNPVEQDTLAPANVHLTAGINGPNGVFGIGPEITAKYEMLVFHPFVVRPAFDIRYGKVTNALHPSGELLAATFSTEFFYYKGTDKLTGYMGGGVVFTDYHFMLNDRAADSLKSNLGITNVRMKNTFGYRFTMGLRIERNYSMEIAITEQRPLFSFTTRISSSSYSESTDKIRMSDVRFTVGYLIPFKIL